MLIKISVEDDKKMMYGNQRFMKAKQMLQNRSLDLNTPHYATLVRCYVHFVRHVPPGRISPQHRYTALRNACTVLCALCASRPSGTHSAAAQTHRTALRLYGVTYTSCVASLRDNLLILRFLSTVSQEYMFGFQAASERLNLNNPTQGTQCGVK